MKVLIYRGEALHGEHELGGQPLRIGRSAENDIVLEDPGKGVSRQHAEIRPEDGGYTLVDLGSQNGVWVHGARVPSVRLEPGVAAAVGPYRLTVPEQVPAAPAPAKPQEPALDPTEYVDPRVVSAAVAMLSPSAETGPMEPVIPPAPPVPPAEHAAGASTVKAAPRAPASSGVRPASPAPAATKPAAGNSKGSLVAVAAVLLLAAAAFGTYRLVRMRAPKPVWSRDAALALVGQGHCDEALQQQIGPALAANPNDADALALKKQCAPPPLAPPAPAPAVVPAPAPPDPTAQALDAVDASLTANDCKSALDAANAVLASAPDNARAQALKTKAEDCVKATARTRPVPAVATAIAPGKGGLEVLPGETPQDYSRRVQAMRNQYDDAVGLLQAQRYLQAQKAFDEIAAGVPAGYLDLAQRRADLNKAMHDDAARQYAAGQQAEQNGDFASAVQHYQRAHDLDGARDVSPDVARITALKARQGHDACTAAAAFYLESRNPEAAAQYKKVLELLPESDPCYKQAKDRLALINGR